MLARPMSAHVQQDSQAPIVKSHLAQLPHAQTVVYAQSRMETLCANVQQDTQVLHVKLLLAHQRLA